MQPDTLILQRFLSLNGKKDIQTSYASATKDHWNKDALSRISFFLFQNNISSAITTIEVDQLPASNLPGIAAQTDDLGQEFYYHWEKGERHLLFARNHTAEGPYQFNRTARFMVYDKEALAAVALDRDPEPAALPKSIFIVLAVFLIILYADLFNGITLPMLLVQVSSLLNAAIAGIILFKEHGIFNAFTERFCNAQVYTGCNKLLHSKASAIYGDLSLATFGTAIYFSVLLYSLLAGSAASYTYWAMALSAGAVCISILLVLKMVLIRVFCRLCLWIHVVNLLSFACLCLLVPLPFEKILRFDYHAILMWIVSFVIAGLLLRLFLLFIDASQKDKAKLDEAGSLKSALLEKVLLQDEDERLQLLRASQQPLSFTFSEEQELELCLILSTHCHFCAELVTAIVQEKLTDKISKLEVYLYTAHEMDPAVAVFIRSLGQAEASVAFAILVDWYKAYREPQNEMHTNATTDNLPSFCLRQQDLPYAELPVVFINGHLIPHVFGAADLERLLYYFSLPG